MSCLDIKYSIFFELNKHINKYILKLRIEDNKTINDLCFLTFETKEILKKNIIKNGNKIIIVPPKINQLNKYNIVYNIAFEMLDNDKAFGEYTYNDNLKSYFDRTTVNLGIITYNSDFKDFLNEL